MSFVWIWRNNSPTPPCGQVRGLGSVLFFWFLCVLREVRGLWSLRDGWSSRYRDIAEGGTPRQGSHRTAPRPTTKCDEASSHDKTIKQNFGLCLFYLVWCRVVGGARFRDLCFESLYIPLGHMYFVLFLVII